MLPQEYLMYSGVMDVQLAVNNASEEDLQQFPARMSTLGMSSAAARLYISHCHLQQ